MEEQAHVEQPQGEGQATLGVPQPAAGRDPNDGGDDVPEDFDGDDDLRGNGDAPNDLLH